MFPGFAISAFSLLLLVYWFRYTCLLILNTRPAKDLTARFAQANQLELPRIQRALDAAPTPGKMDALRVALDTDYDIVTGILLHNSPFDLDPAGAELRMLMLDYRCAGAAYTLLRKLRREAAAHSALGEMTAIVAHLANSLAQRSGRTGLMQ
jgi:hypothetical protein